MLNPGTNRTGLTAAPETLRIPVVADREHRPHILSGLSATLRVARTDSVEAISFLRFTAIPADTASISSAWLGFLVRGGSGAGLTVTAYEVKPDPNWAWGETADSANSVFALSLADTVRIGDALRAAPTVITPPTGDTVFVRRVVEIDGAILRRWLRLPAENEGIALRLGGGGGAGGSLEFLSREGQPDSARAANPVLEFMQGDAVLSVTSPAADAFVYIDKRPATSGSSPTITVADWLPQRAMFRFALLDSLKRRYGSQYDRVTIQRASLYLHVVAEPDSSERAAAHGISTSSGWEESTDPGAIELTSATDVKYLTDALGRPALDFRLECGSAARSWVHGSREDGILVRSTGELTTSTRFTLYTREAADSSLRPRLDLVFTRPPDPRWGTGGGQ